MGNKRAKFSTSSKELKKTDPLKLSISNSTSGCNSGLTNPRLLSLHQINERENEDQQNNESMNRSLRQTGIRPPRPFDRIENLESWINSIEFHFEVTKCSAKDKTGSLLLLLEVECLEVA